MNTPSPERVAVLWEWARTQHHLGFLKPKEAYAPGEPVHAGLVDTALWIRRFFPFWKPQTEVKLLAKLQHESFMAWIFSGKR